MCAFLLSRPQRRPQACAVTRWGNSGHAFVGISKIRTSGSISTPPTLERFPTPVVFRSLIVSLILVNTCIGFKTICINSYESITNKEVCCSMTYVVLSWRCLLIRRSIWYLIKVAKSDTWIQHDKRVTNKLWVKAKWVRVIFELTRLTCLINGSYSCSTYEPVWHV